ncbi:MAG TPA: DEAD/DEAH box helicase [Solirubrobacteraceae bacterium]|nr:DEAD/DEAH box helicase [Solirubrobacteraceae bacterium]
MSTQSFADLGVSPPVLAALADRGITDPFAVQKLVIADVLAGHDVLAKSPTGSGKTLAFGIPLVERLDANGPKQSALILAPTRELVLQITEELRDIAHARALAVAALYGGAGIERQSKLARRAHVLVATPGRLEDLIGRGTVRLDRIRVIVLDEADRMLDMGFRPVVDRILAQTPSNRQTLLFSATLDGEVGRMASAYTDQPRRHEHKPAQDQPRDIQHQFVAVEHADKLARLIDLVRGNGVERALVFVRTKRGADRLVKRLRARGVEAVAMHGDKTQGQRERALARFERGECDLLVATDVAARGLDVDGISHVIHFDAPGDRESYVHRAGRTGRAGRSGSSITFVMPDQVSDVSRFAGELSLHHEFTAAGFGERHGANRPHAGSGHGGGSGHGTGSGHGPSRRRGRGGRRRQPSRDR